MYLKFQCLFIHLVTQNILISNQEFVNKQMNKIDVSPKNGRRYYNFGDNSDVKKKMKYKQLNIKPLRKQNGVPVDPGNNTSNAQTATTPVLFVTIPAVTATVPTATIPTAPITQSSPIPVTMSIPTTVSIPLPNPSQENTTFPEASTPVQNIGQAISPGVPTTVPTLTSPVQSTVPSLAPVIISAPTTYIVTQASPVGALSVSDASTVNLNISSPFMVPQNGTTPQTSAVNQSISSPTSLSASPTTGATSMSETTAQFEMTFPNSVVTTAPPIIKRSEIAQQAAQDMKVLGAGYFTVLLLELTKVFPKKDPDDATRLLQAMESEVVKLLSEGKLSGFGKSTTASFVMFVRSINNSPIEAMQYHASISTYILMNRRQTLSREIVNLLDQADSMLLEEEGKRIFQVLEDLDNYPNINSTAWELMHELFDAAMIAPMIRVYGTPGEISMVQQLENLIIKMVYSGYSIQRRAELSMTTKIEKSLKYRKLTPKIKNKKYTDRRIQNTTMELRNKYTTRTSLKVNKNQKNIKVNYKTKVRPKKLKGVKVGKFKIIYLKLKDLDLGRTSKTTYNTKTTKEYTRSNKQTNAHRHKHQKKTSAIDKDTKRYTVNKRKNKEKHLTIGRFMANKMKEESLFSDEEERLQANLDDAFFHGTNEIVFRNRDRADIEKEKDIFPESSYSNEETVLKSKIYKAFGYDNDFAEAVKRRG